MKNTLNRENINKINLLVPVVIMIVLLIGFFGSKNVSTINIATKPMTEQYILGEMMKLLIEEKYDALNNNTVDVLNIFTTDGGLSDSAIKILKDDKRFYQTYFCGNVVRSDTLKSHPELFEILMIINGIISDEDMSKMNHLVESGQKQDFEVAREFLKSKKLIK